MFTEGNWEKLEEVKGKAQQDTVQELRNKKRENHEGSSNQIGHGFSK